jgi:phosphoglycolate phosphatase-like HAD superfamily hydrolase
LAWREALQRGGIELAVWRIHRRIGMSGGLFVNALLRETGRPAPPQQAEKFQKFHSEAYLKQVQRVQPLPGAKELLKSLTKARVRWAIATSGRIAFARPSLDALEVPSSVPIITRDQVERAKKALRTPSLSATASGICLPHGGRGLWEWEFYPAGVGRMNLSAPELIAFTRIRTIC